MIFILELIVIYLISYALFTKFGNKKGKLVRVYQDTKGRRYRIKDGYSWRVFFLGPVGQLSMGERKTPLIFMAVISFCMLFPDILGSLAMTAVTFYNPIMAFITPKNIEKRYEAEYQYIGEEYI